MTNDKTECNNCMEEIAGCDQCDKILKGKIYCMPTMDDEGRWNNAHYCSKKCLLFNALDCCEEARVER